MKKLLLSLVLVFVFSSSAFAGCISGDCVNGYGTYLLANGDKYVGEFKDSKRNGQGTYTYANGAKYVGEYKDDEKNGQGTFTWATGEWAGDKYIGEFKDDGKNGQGTYISADGTITTGVWENNIYFGTRAEWDAAEKKYDRIYNACLIDKSSGLDMQVTELKEAVEETCKAIAEDPSWYEGWKYN